jgi:hypothetical protein
VCSSEIPITQLGEVVVFETMHIMHLKHEVKMIPTWLQFVEMQCVLDPTQQNDQMFI